METLEELQKAWNNLADRQNQWFELGLDEIVDFAQKRAIAEYRSELHAEASKQFYADQAAHPTPIETELNLARDEIARLDELRKQPQAENEAQKQSARAIPADGHVRKPVWMPPTGQSLGLVKINGHSYIRPVMKVAKVMVDGAICVVPLGDLYDMLEGGVEYTVKVETISVREFERMAEFTGW